MSNTEHTGGAAHRSFRCTFGPVREVDLVWPPADEDVDAFTVIHLDDSDVQPPRLEPPSTEPASPESVGPEPVGPEPARLAPRRIKPTFGDCRARDAAPRVRALVVPIEPPHLPGPAVPDAPAVTSPPVVSEESQAGDEPADDAVAATAEAPPFPFPAAPPPAPETVSARRSAWVAVFFAAACALATFAEYRARSPVNDSEAPPVPAQVSVADVPTPDSRAVAPSAASKPAKVERTAAAAPARPAPEPTPVPTPRLALASPGRDVEPARPVPPRVTVDVHDRGVVAAKVEPRATPTGRPEPQPAVAARIEAAPPPVPIPPPFATAAARPEPLATAAPAPSATPTPVRAVVTDPASDEADIQSTLTRFRTAYSQLNARAARDVWPSVDARALERAFQSLKSQDLRFDSCKMTVTGARAQAACKGRAVYVPRIGDQSPRFTAREWNFELRKADERWTIASARSL